MQCSATLTGAVVSQEACDLPFHQSHAEVSNGQFAVPVALPQPARVYPDVLAFIHSERFEIGVKRRGDFLSFGNSINICLMEYNIHVI
jgi:hypothetical protein